MSCDARYRIEWKTYRKLFHWVYVYLHLKGAAMVVERDCIKIYFVLRNISLQYSK